MLKDLETAYDRLGKHEKMIYTLNQMGRAHLFLGEMPQAIACCEERSIQSKFLK